MSISEFLAARLDEEGAVASQLLIDLRSQIEAEWQGQEDEQGPMTPSRMLSAQLWRNYDGQQRWRSFARGQQIARLASPDRVRADIAAKRAILTDYVTTCRLRDEAAERIRAAGDHPGTEDLRSWARARDEAAVLDQLVMPRLAQPYADHPDYSESWKP